MCMYIYLFIYIHCVSQKACNAEIDHRDIEAKITRRAHLDSTVKVKTKVTGIKDSLPSLLVLPS